MSLHRAGLTKLVGKRIELTQTYKSLLTPPEQSTIERMIDALEKEIDSLVYALYALSSEEILLVEMRSK